MKNKVVIGTRGSMLALWQAEWVKSLLIERNPGLEVELNKIKTTGDKILDVPLAKVGGKGLFVKEIEESLLSNNADLAVHSMKDVPTVLPEGLHLGAVLMREDPRDALLSKDGKGFKDLKQGAVVGTSSLRRACQLKSARPDIEIVSLRGNLDTRIRKLKEGQFDAVVLALAGIKRLGYEKEVTEVLPTELTLPAIAQGAVGIECRTGDAFINGLIKPLNHLDSAICVSAERACLTRLEGGCQVPIAAHAVLKDGMLHISGLVGSESGDKIIRAERSGSPDNAERIGTELAEELLQKGAKQILDVVYGRIYQINQDV